MDKLKRALGAQPAEAQSEENLFTELTTLSWSTRIKGFTICFVLGFVFSILGVGLLILPTGTRLFCLFYTLGNISAIFATLFLMGPVNQFKKMFNSSRWIASVMMISFLILTMMAGLYWKKRGLTILFCMCQFLSMTWYSLSYIPYAREAVKKTFSTCIDV
ncbi:vesicle transport protein SFT2A [Galendromus occidentalis]|uniref:Vesicle transport protein n=1 Tax=Galendromus occidentalis TaxID=34638 RepID=A0AAJ6QU81_9ACAR|nr:vesicle transport protein SFT2A [Galendromus occidentalis]